MDSDIAELIEMARIRRVLERYCRSIDRFDKDLLLSVYWPGAIDNHGTYIGPAEGFADYVFPVLAHYESTIHAIAQSLIQLDGEKAGAETYCHVMHRGRDADGVFADLAWCRYVDRFEKRDGEWRISDRKLLVEHIQRIRDNLGGELSVGLFHPSHRDRSDVSYPVLDSPASA